MTGATAIRDPSGTHYAIVDKRNRFHSRPTVDREEAETDMLLFMDMENQALMPEFADYRVAIFTVEAIAPVSGSGKERT